MFKVAFKDEIRDIETAADAAGVTFAMMMENAGRAVANRVIDLLVEKAIAHVIVLVGPGNNGGDGLVAGRIISQESNILVTFYLLSPRTEDDLNFDSDIETKSSFVLSNEDHDKSVLRNLVDNSDLVLDAMFGIGVRLPLRSDIAEILSTVKQAVYDIRSPDLEMVNISPTLPKKTTNQLRPYVLALDCPSGVDCDTGAIDPSVISADETITFIAAKQGLFEYPAFSYTGQLTVATIGVPAILPELNKLKRIVLETGWVGELLPVRPAHANKGTFGKVLVVGGSGNYVGAAGLAAMSAYLSGSGLVTVCAVQQVVAALSASLFEPTWLVLPDEQGSVTPDGFLTIIKVQENYDSILVGPGLGTRRSTSIFLTGLLTDPAIMPPLVVDADALNLLSEVDNWWTLLPRYSVITPHPGEMARLSRLTIDEIQNQRWQLAVSKAAEWNVVLVLKGANTLIADPDGNIAVVPIATDALATAGTGDVLAGLISGFLAQGLTPFLASLVGTFTHGLAGLDAKQKVGTSRSVIARDVLNAIPSALSKLEFGRIQRQWE